MRPIYCGLAALLTTATLASAQPSTASKAQLKLTNAMPGVNIDVYMDAGKTATVTIGANGEAALDLDFLNLGKPSGQLYVETCKDGQRVRIISDGTIVPTDDGCDRKPVGALFAFTCKGITLNLAAVKASFACGGLPKWTYAAPGAVLPFLFDFGDNGSPMSPPVGAPPAQQPVASAPAVPPAAPTPPPTTPQPPAAPTTIDPSGTYDVSVCTVVFDPASHNAVLRFCELVRQILASASNGGVTFTANAPWVTIGGTYNTTTGEFSLGSSGTVAGFPNVAATLRGNVTFTGTFFGELEIGSNGALPAGQPIRIQVRAQKR
jgi:hypothetical protein